MPLRMEINDAGFRDRRGMTFVDRKRETLSGLSQVIS